MYNAGRLRSGMLAGSPVVTIVVSIFVVLFGLAFGSFLNVCIARLPRHKSIVRPGSRCPQCGAAIRVFDNLPLLSWVVLRGRCRDCRRQIPWRYPAVEFATAALFLLSFLRFRLTLAGIGMAALCFLLLGLAVMDAETLRLPDAFTLPGIALGIIYCGLLPAATTGTHLLDAALAALWAALAAMAILIVRSAYYLVRHEEGMGIGDAKLLAMIAAWLGPWLTLLTLVLGVVAAAMLGMVMIAVGPRRGGGAKARLPFGAFLCAAAIYAIFAGRPIVHWYLRFFR